MALLNNLLVIHSNRASYFMVILSLSFFYSNTTIAQTKIDTAIERIVQVEKMIIPGNNQYVASYVFDNILGNMQKQISGFQTRNGKTPATSATIQEKSITLNYTFSSPGHFFIQPTVSGSSKKDFVSIFSNDKYQRTLTGGLNFVFFSKPGGSFETSDRTYIHNVLRYIKSTNPKGPDRADFKKDILNFLNAYDSARPLYLAMEKQDLDFENIDTLKKQLNVPDTATVTRLRKYLQNFYDLSKKMVKAHLLREDWDLWPADEVGSFVNQIRLKHKAYNWENIVDQRRKMQMYDSVQSNAWWKSFRYYWFSGGIQYNHSINPLFDSSAGVAKLFTKDSYDEYFTAQVSWNILFSNQNKGINTWISPTVKFSSQKPFDPDSLISLQKQSLFIVAGDTIVATNKTTSFYRHDTARRFQVSVELPFTKYWVDKKFGIDIAATCILSPSFDQLGARVGIYIPISTGDKQIVIEPLLNFIKLNRGHLTFLKDQVSFGFSLSVSIPKFITGG